MDIVVVLIVFMMRKITTEAHSRQVGLQTIKTQVEGVVQVDSESEELHDNRILDGADLSLAWYFPGNSVAYYFMVNPLTLPSTFTIELWLKPVITDVASFWFSWATIENVNCALYRSSWASVGSWYYVVITWDGISNNVYIDGVLSNELIFQSFCGSYTGILVLGQDQDSLGGGFSASQAANMYVNTVAVYNRSWTSIEISTIGTSKTCIDLLDPTIISAWIGESASDRAGNGNDATVVAINTTSGVAGICSDPTPAPTLHQPSPVPSSFPTFSPTFTPSRIPTPLPTIRPTISHIPSSIPSSLPSTVPTSYPTPGPSPVPTFRPSPLPSPLPSISLSPTPHPSLIPTFTPTHLPSLAPTSLPSNVPTVHCVSGTYFSEESLFCMNCPIGSYSNFEGAPFPTSCSLCPAGKYNTASGSSECTDCATGKLSSTDRTFCDDCNAGEYNYNNTACVECEYGKYAPQALTGSCLECGAGFHTNAASKATSCTACDAGTYSLGASLNCSSCDRGKFSSGGVASCTECGEGFIAPVVGSSLCSACSAGEYSLTPSNCSTCPKGQYQGSTGQPSCFKCDSGSYSNTEGSVACENCALEFTSVSGSASCLLATDGYFLRYDAFRSEICPGHTKCNGGDYAPIPNKGYWVDRSSYIHVSDIYACPRETCKGANSNSSCWRYSAYNQSTSNDDVSECHMASLLCKEGAFGPLCGACEVAYVYSGETKTCVRCGGAIQFVFTLLGVLGGVTVFIGLLVYHYGWLPRLSMLHIIDSGSLKVLWVTYQIIVSVSWNLDIAFPAVFGDMLSVLSVLSLDILSLECFQGHSDDRYFTTVYLWSIIPMGVAVIIPLAGLVRYMFAPPGSLSWLFNQHVWLLLLWSYLVLPPVTMKQLQGLDCIPFKHDDSSYLRVDTSVNCISDEYAVFKGIDIMFFCGYQLIPVLWMILLYRCREALYIAHGANEEFDLNERDANPSLSHIRFLFKDYKGDKWWFEVAEMYRRIMFVGLLPLFTPSSSKRASLGCIFAIVSYIYFREEEPFRVAFTNNIACIAQVTILLTFYTALSIESGVVIDFGLGTVGTGIFLVFVNIVVFSLVLVVSYQRFKRFQHEQQWRRALTTQELDIVNNIIGEEVDISETNISIDGDGVEMGRHLKSAEEKDAIVSDLLKQSLLHPRDVVILKKVGAGAFGEVFKGTCMGELVAIKTMLDITEDNVREFKAEIVLTTALRHPNIVNFVGACWDKELMCLVLEWVAKGSLRDFLETKDLRWNEPLLSLAIDIVRGMKYLHNRKYYDEREGETLSCILHRDLKPDNALVSEFIVAKLADFGTSRAKGEADVTMTAVGTPLYVAPEIARGEFYDEKVDVYSFGLTLMEMCVEEPLLDFIGARWVIAFDKKKIPKQPMRLIRPMTEDGWRPVTDENPISFAPPTINSLIMQCCAHDPSQRPSFEEILEELNGNCKEEIESTNFGRRRLVDNNNMSKEGSADIVPQLTSWVVQNPLPPSTARTPKTKIYTI